MNKWDKRYLDLAELVASWSKDPSTKVGGCIIDENGNPVSFGFNGFPKDMKDTPERLEDRTFKYAHTIHSEKNCIGFANRTYFDGCTIYITHPPCSSCLCEMKQRRLTKVVCYDGGKEFRERWQSEDVINLAQELGVSVTVHFKEPEMLKI